MIPCHPVFGIIFYTSNYQFHYLLFEPIGVQTNDLNTRDEHTNYYTTVAVINHMGYCLCTDKYTMYIMSASLTTNAVRRRKHEFHLFVLR